MKEKIYRNYSLYIILLIVWLIMIAIVLLVAAPSYTSLLFLLGIISSTVVLLTIPQICSKKIVINDIGISESENKMYRFYKETRKDLRWDEVGYIFDDYVQPILFYPPYKLHIFHLMPKKNIHKPFRRVSISYVIKNYKDLLCEVVSRVDTNVKIDDYVHEFVEIYKKSEDRIIRTS